MAQIMDNFGVSEAIMCCHPGSLPADESERRAALFSASGARTGAEASLLSLEARGRCSAGRGPGMRALPDTHRPTPA